MYARPTEEPGTGSRRPADTAFGKPSNGFTVSILVTGGAGFVGSNLAMKMKGDGHRVVALDNLKRRGSELNIARLAEAGVEFVHGDIRNKEDFPSEPFGLVLECSAEPSVTAGYGGDSPEYLINTNLAGTINCLEFARRHASDFVFLSTSRVYPMAKLSNLRYSEGETRFELEGKQPFPGASGHGISEEFPLGGARSLYGATKLASEMFVEEYREAYGIKAVVNRCGVVTGPWQMGKVDQGVFALWMARHYFRAGNLAYIGYGGEGKQVRDLLHIDDLFDLVRLQTGDLETFDGGIFNVGGGKDVSLSLRETTELCREISGNEIKIGSDPETRRADIPVYITDCGKITELCGWRPKRGAEATMRDIFEWISSNETLVKRTLTA